MQKKVNKKITEHQKEGLTTENNLFAIQRVPVLRNCDTFVTYPFEHDTTNSSLDIKSIQNS